MNKVPKKFVAKEVVPRERAVCPSCNGEVVLCNQNNGDIIEVHVDNKTVCTFIDPAKWKTNTPHNRALYRALMYLSYSGAMTIVVLCSLCGIKTDLSPPPKVKTWVTEYKYTAPNGTVSILDIAGLDEHGVVIYAIEIVHTHETQNYLGREGIIWVEIRASDMERELDRIVGDSSSVVNLVDVKRRHNCTDKAACQAEMKRQQDEVARKKMMAERDAQDAILEKTRIQSLT